MAGIWSLDRRSRLGASPSRRVPETPRGHRAGQWPAGEPAQVWLQTPLLPAALQRGPCPLAAFVCMPSPFPLKFPLFFLFLELLKFSSSSEP